MNAIAILRKSLTRDEKIALLVILVGYLVICAFALYKLLVEGRVISGCFLAVMAHIVLLIWSNRLIRQVGMRVANERKEESE